MEREEEEVFRAMKGEGRKEEGNKWREKGEVEREKD